MSKKKEEIQEQNVEDISTSETKEEEIMVDSGSVNEADSLPNAKRKFDFFGSKKNIIFFVFTVLFLVLMIWLFSGKEEVQIKGYDQTLVESKIKEISNENVKLMQQVLERLDNINKNLSEQKTSKPDTVPSDQQKSGDIKGSDLENLNKKLGDLLLPGGASDKEKLNFPSFDKVKPKLSEKEISFLNKGQDVNKDNSMAVPVSSTQIKSDENVSGAVKEDKKKFFLPAGTIVEGKLFTGVVAPVKNAPSSYKSPIAVIGLTRNGVTPGFRSFPLKSAVILARAEGIWNLERAVMETYKLVLVTKDGKVIEKNITGQIVGEDGVDGIPGELVNPGEGKRMINYFAGSALSGFFAAMGQTQSDTFTNAYGTTTTQIKDKLLYELALGLSKTWDNFSAWYLEQMKQAYPFVAVKPGKKVYVIIQDGVTLDV